jgi:Leucine-rich repeat (LRR) protein
MPRLETLNIADNEIAGLVDRSFSTLESLKYLNLSHNKIPYIGPWTFAGASKTKLEELDLSFNLITVLYPVSIQ